MRALCVIPARIGSTRLLQKPLQLVDGVPLVTFTTRRILSFGLFDHVVVATDNAQIADAVEGLAVEVVMTSPAHRCGTERVAEVVANRGHQRAVNVQSDEAFIQREAVVGALRLVEGGAALSTAAMELTAGQRLDRHTTKVAVDRDGRAAGFHRTMADLGANGHWVGRHLGIYGYQREALLRWAAADQNKDELSLGLEQLRPMAYGEAIAVARLPGTGCTSIDTPSDLEAAELYMTETTEWELV